MRMRSVKIAAIAFFIAIVAWPALPKCEREQDAMIYAESDMHEAWKAWKQAFEKEKAASARAEQLWPRATAARAALMKATANADQAGTAANNCHRTKGYGGKCAAEERAQAAARDRLRRAQAEYHAAYDALNRALEASISATEDEKKLFDKASALEDAYHAALDAYNRCLRGKRMA